MNARQRRKACRAAMRQTEINARAKCVRYGIDPDRWGSVTLKFDAEDRRVFNRMMQTYSRRLTRRDVR